MPVSVKLMMTDDRGAGYRLDFAAHLNRSWKLRYERRKQQRVQLFDPAQRAGLYGPARSQYGDRNVTLTSKEKDTGTDRCSPELGNLEAKQAKNV